MLVRPTHRQKLVFFITVIALLVGCGGGGGDNEESNISGNVAGSSSEARASCGVLRETLETNVDLGEGQFLSNVTALSPNVVTAEPGTGPLVIKLLSLPSLTSLEQQLSVAKLNELVAGGVYFFARPSPCVATTSTGGVAASGQLITPAGLDVAEELIKAGLAGHVETSGSCGEELIAPCYSNLLAQYPQQNAGLIVEFLWKPESGGDFLPGHLAVLVNTDPCNVIIVANGEILQNYGPSNGRCMTSRSLTRTGCAFGSNAKVEVFSEVTGLPYVFPDGNPYIINPNGCERLQFKL